MNTIERKLLSLSVTNVDINLLEDIINATPNPTVAVEILCGLYVPPVIARNIWKNDVVCTLRGFDKWNDRVDYTYERLKKASEYFPSEVDRLTITKDNYLQLRCAYRDGHTYNHTITLDVMEEVKDYMSLDQWNKYNKSKPYISEGKVKQMEYENMYSINEETAE